jgi:serine/threonine-protein kinase
MGNLDNVSKDAPRTDPLVGRVLAGRYDIVRLLGEGGMGRVYEGRQRALDRPVAVKCIHRHFLSTEQMLVRFMEEARVASQLVHPNIVKIYDFGRTDGPEQPTFFLVMELLAGEHLGTVIQREAPMPLGRVYSVIVQILSALGEAHAHGVTHRDAKPDNVVLSAAGRGERVKIIDFGVAKVHGSPGVTSAGAFVGTPHYMPPEQIRGETAEVSSDLYAAGVTLFYMITGRLPFDAPTILGVIEQQLYAPRPDPRATVGARCPDALAAVCLRALHVDPKQRFASADEFSEAIEAALANVLSPASLRNPYSVATFDAANVPPSGPRSARPSEPSNPQSSSNRPFPLTRMHDTTQASSLPTTTGLPPPPSTPSSEIRPRPSRLADISLAERIERTAEAELEAGRHDSAAAEFGRGLALGRCWFEAGDLEIGAAASTVFGRKLGALMRDMGRLEDSERVLRTALGHTEPEEASRARVLAELAATLAERGRVGAAEGYRVEALRIAAAGRDRELTARLRRMAQSFAIAVATRRPVSDHPPPDAPRAAPAAQEPRWSEWRVRPGTDEPSSEELELRRRR